MSERDPPADVEGDSDGDPGSVERTASPNRIAVQCLSCGRTSTLDGSDRRVRDEPLVYLTRRLRCSACGSRAVKAIAIRTPRDVARLLAGRIGATRPKG